MIIYEYVTLDKLSRLALSFETSVLHIFDVFAFLNKTHDLRLKTQHSQEPSILSVP